MYEVSARLNETDKPAVVHFALGQVKMQQEVPSKTTRVVFSKVRLPSGTGQLECFAEQTSLKSGVRDVEIKRIGRQ